MGYISEHLTDNERVVFLTKQHWITMLSWPLLLLITGGLMLVLALYQEWQWMRYASLAFFAIGILYGLYGLVVIACTEFGVTTKRVIIKTGVIWRNTQEIILQKIESISVNQSIGGRLLGYGTIIITGSGGSNDPYKNIAQPLDFRKAVQEQVEAISKDHD